MSMAVEMELRKGSMGELQSPVSAPPNLAVGLFLLVWTVFVANLPKRALTQGKSKAHHI